MIKIICPSSNLPERIYSIETLFTDVMGCERNEYVIVPDEEAKDYCLLYDEKSIVVEDHFFKYYAEPLSYLNIDNIPTDLHYFHALGYEIPIIYGKDKFVEDGDNIVIGLDLFASTYYMLTRWEEYLIGREEKGDCRERNLFIVENGIHLRPIVNEYADFLLGLLPRSLRIKEQKYKVILSHDVDGLLTPSWRRIFRDLVHQLRFGPPTNTAVNLTWKEEIKYKMAFPKDSSQFELYTALSEKYKIQEWFYFKACARGEKEDTYWYNDRRTIGVINNLKKKKNPDFILGFHPSQSVFKDKNQWDMEVSRITNTLGQTPIIGRNHHLLYNVEMLRWWEELSEKPVHISNCVFHRKQGFRSGVCKPYHCFDIFKRRTMQIVEHPCQIMDMPIRYERSVKTDEEEWQDIKNIVDQVKRFQGELVITWHIYIRRMSILNNIFPWCEKVIEYAVEEG